MKLCRHRIASHLPLLLFALCPMYTRSGALQFEGRRAIGVLLSSVHEASEKDLPGTLKSLARMGYNGVEITETFGRTAEELRRLLDETHLKCYGAQVTLRALTGDALAATITLNKTLGNRYVAVTSVPAENRSTHEALLETARQLNEIALKLEHEGMILGYHVHAYDFQPVEGERPWDTIFSHVDRRVTIQFDTGSALRAGVQAVPLLRYFAGRLWSVHLTDYSPSNPNAMLGDGDERWPEAIRLLTGMAGASYFILVPPKRPGPPLANAENCLRSFERMEARFSP